MKLYGPKHPDTIDCRHEQGLIVLMERRFDNAEVLFKEALNNMQATLGPCYLTTIACTRNLAETLFHQRKFDQAISKCQDALQCSNELCGSDHLSTLKILNLYCCLTECLAGQVIRIRDTDALEGDGKQTQLQQPQLSTRALSAILNLCSENRAFKKCRYLVTWQSR